MQASREERWETRKQKEETKEKRKNRRRSLAVRGATYFSGQRITYWLRCCAQLQRSDEDIMLINNNYTVQRRHSQRTRTHPYEHTHANPTPMSIFEDWAGRFWRD
uniref:Uncharacterized protein n=1 Tax=Oryza rufipogon TaxID=4529 RepID=A0A0E0MZ26_ORYRU